jgi:aspartate 1-decarboxylase
MPFRPPKGLFGAQASARSIARDLQVRQRATREDHVRTMLKSKIHRATVTGADINYEGSITLDPLLMDAADILPYEQVQVLDINNGNRLTTYAIEGRRSSGDVVINGAAARLVSEGDIVIILTYVDVPEEAARGHKPALVHVDEDNRITRVAEEIAA